MTALLTIREPLGERSFDAGEFPLSIGGAGSTITVASAGAGAIAWLGLQDEQLFVQPAETGAALLHNGLRVEASTWVRDGDVLDVGGGRLKATVERGRTVLHLSAGGTDNATAPPVVEAPASIAGTGSGEEAIEAVAFRRSPIAAAADDAGRLRSRLVIGAAFAALLGAAAWLFTSVPVHVESTPAAQDIDFEGGGPDLGFGSSHLLRPGQYTLVVAHEGYATLRQPVTVTREGPRQLAVALQPLPGRLRIEIPVPGTVSVAGKVVGKVPGDVELPAGKYDVTIDTERYLDFVASVHIEGLGKVQTLTPKLVPGWADVSISSEPAGAAVTVAGESRGVTPLTLELMGGNHRLELRRTGFNAWQSDIVVKANTPLAIGPVKLGIPDGVLVVRSSPSGANVTIGGVYRGRTPLDVPVRPDVPQSIAVSRDGYTPVIREVRVASSAKQVVDVSLPAILGDVIVRARPSGAELFVDNVSKGAADQTLRLPATAHVLEIRKQGYAPYRTTVTPRPNLPQNIDVTLLEGVAATAASAPIVAGGAAIAGAAAAATATPAIVALTPTIRAPGGNELKLVPAGSYTMGSPRREAGRRANEAQRSVDLQRRFYVGLREITNSQFREFRPDHRSGFVGQTTLELERQPVVNVRWQDAAAYCNWLSAKEGLKPAYEAKGDRLVAVAPATNGYRLPTEAEWEWVARNEGGGKLRKYPWGDSLPVPPDAGNYADRVAQPLVPQFLADYDDGYAVTAPVGSYAANALGFLDLGGNVAEWTHDVYNVQPAGDGAIDPAQAGDGGLHTIRGSSWKHSGVTELRLAFRDYGDGRRNDVGFRIARYAQ